MTVDFKIFTLNCWGIPVVSKNRKVRMQAIAEVLATSDYDVVCLQEVWSSSDYELMRDKLNGTFSYSHYFYSGVAGSGVCVLSKHSIKEVFFHQWPVNGYVHKLQHGDWFGGKGVGLCKLKVKNYNINIYSAHLHAEYDRQCDEYQAHRVLQAFDTAQFIQLTSGRADLVVLAGDLNTEPGDLAYRILVGMTGLTDTFTEVTEMDNENSNTNECWTNSYTESKLVKQKFCGKRIDYIMYFAGSDVNAKLQKYCLPLPNRVPNCSYSYSDHEAVATTLTINKSENLFRTVDFNERISVLKESMDICDAALKRLLYHKRVYWFISALLFFILIVTVAIEAPFGWIILYHIVRVIITGFACFTVVMASLWNGIETNAVFAGKLAMDVRLKRYLIKQEL